MPAHPSGWPAVAQAVGEQAVPVRVADRRFRPDVEGLRAIAVLMVILAHAGIGVLAGGYVGVDVFFVLSGFLITGLLVNEHESRANVSLANFYARRARRILPAATIVLLATLIGSYFFLGSGRAGEVAGDAQWTALFASNIRFIQQGTDYLASQLPPSPLQHFWSLAVEEQFYAVWPLAVILIASIGTSVALRTKLGVALVVTIVVSLAWSIVQTTSNGATAYFSPLTRAWELATGALLAVATPMLLGLPRQLGILASVLGVGAMIAAGLLFSDATSFPGYAAALPVTGAALAVAGGTIAPGAGAETFLRLPVFQWLGKLSYSLYLWHWPALMIPRQALGRDLLPAETALALLVAVVLSALTYRLIENPVRNSTWLKSNRASISVALGAVFVVVSLLAATGVIGLAPHAEPAQSAPDVLFPSE